MSGDEDGLGRLDRLLRAPLAPVADNGFSARVMAKLARADVPRSVPGAALLSIVAGLLLALFTAGGFSEWVERTGYSLATSLPLATAAFVLALTILGMRAFAD